MSFYKYAMDESSAASDALKGSLIGAVGLGLAAPKLVERRLNAEYFGGVDHDYPWKVVRSTNPLELYGMYRKAPSDEAWRAFEGRALADDAARKGLSKWLHRAKNLGLWAVPGIALGGAMGALGGLAFNGVKSLVGERE